MKTTTAICARLILVLLLSGCLGAITRRPEKIRIYEGVVFSSKEISGSNRFAEPNERYLTAIPEDLEAIDLGTLYSRVGSYRADAAQRKTLPLFNMSARNAVYPLLDKIDLSFYEEIGFDRLQGESDFIRVYKPLYDRFLSGYQKAPSQAAKKDTLNRDSYRVIKNYLVGCRLLVRRDSVKFSMARQSQLTAGLKAELTNLKLPNGSDLSPDIKVYLSSLVDQSFKVSGFYYVIRLNDDYVGKIRYVLNSTRTQDLPHDEFSDNLKECVNALNSAINSQVVAFELLGGYKKSRVTTTQLSAELTAKYQLQPAQAASLAVSVNAAFERKIDRNLQVAFNHIYFIRYCTNTIVDKLAFKN